MDVLDVVCNVEEVGQEDLDRIVGGLGASNRMSADLRDEWEWKEVGVVARRRGSVVGGALGRTGWAWLYVARLWVAEELRRSGIGSRLMTTIESEARARGCVGAWLDTFSFQARPFYESLGYQQFGELSDFPPGHSRHFMAKSFK